MALLDSSKSNGTSTVELLHNKASQYDVRG